MRSFHLETIAGTVFATLGSGRQYALASFFQGAPRLPRCGADKKRSGRRYETRERKFPPTSCLPLAAIARGRLSAARDRPRRGVARWVGCFDRVSPNGEVVGTRGRRCPQAWAGGFRLVGPAAHTAQMTRRITETFHGYEQPDVLVTLPDDEHPGELKGNLRAWAVDDETGDWWGMCQYYVATGVQLLRWVHESQLRRDGDLTDDDGRVALNVVALRQV